MKKKKIVLSIVFSTVIILVLVFSVILPTFSRFQDGLDDPEWDGMVANSFKSGTGTQEDPYIISTPNELAYFATSLQNEDYEGKYIKLTKDMIINKGIFKDNTYIYNDLTYYRGNNHKYYSDESLLNEVGSINIFPIIDGFKGTFDGDFHTIYGIYEEGNNRNALFTNLEGELKNLYMENAYISGGNITAGVVAEANHAALKNILFSGTVMGNNQVQETTKTVQLDNFTVLNTVSKSIDLPVISNVSENVLIGTCSGADTFTLNNTVYACSNFEIEVSNQFEITTTSEATFSNVSYQLTYEENKTSGIVGVAYNSDLDGLVNEGTVNGLYSSGIAGTLLNTNMKNSYNKGKVSGTKTAGVVDTIMNSNIYLRNVYNNGDLLTGTKSGLVSNVYHSTVSIEKVFNTYNANMVGNNSSSTLNVQNSFNAATDSNNSFQALNYATISPLYPKYTSDENISNGYIWIGEEAPILYFDDIKNRTVQIKIDNTTWDHYETNLVDMKYNDEINVLITTTDLYKPIKNVWYYASNIALTKAALTTVNWTEYDGIFSLDDNVYILYVKYEDYNDNIYYINTDKLIIGDVNASASIRSGNVLWTTLHTPTKKYINQNMTFDVLDNGTSLLISKIEYLLASDTMTEQELEEAEWTTYTTAITPSRTTYVLYVKVTDTNSNVSYINTDKMINMSYEISNLKSGNNMTFSNYMRLDSSFNFDVSMTHRVSTPSFRRYLKVNKQLPNDTIITLKDSNNNYYEYVVSTHTYDSNVNGYLYAFSDFKRVGKATFDEYFSDTNYNGLSPESFNIALDFKNNSHTTDDYQLSIIAKNNEIINTKHGQDVSFNLVSTDTNTLSVSSNYNSTIDYGIDSTYNVSLATSLTPALYNTHSVTNTLYEHLYEGITIEVYDQQNHIVSRDNLDALRFRYNNTTYVFDRNNRVNINLGTNLNQNVALQIITSKANTNLNGTYSLKIKGYLSLDGVNKKYLGTNTVSIPIRFTSTNNLDYDFDVQLSNPIITKGRNTSFDVSYEGDLDDPTIRVSLYHKKELTAYDQEYELVDLEDYVSNNLNEITDSIYEFNVDDIVLNINNNVERNGYKFVFSLYDGDTKIKEVDVMTIIK